MRKNNIGAIQTEVIRIRRLVYASLAIGTVSLVMAATSVFLILN